MCEAMTGSYKMTGEQLRGIRGGLRLSQESLAEILGVSSKTIVRIENGSEPIDNRTALAIAWIIKHGPDYPWGPFGVKE